MFHPKYLVKWSLRAFDLGALRLHAAVSKHHAETDECPIPEELSGPKWASVNRDVNTGKAFAVTAPARDRLLLSSTDFVGEAYEGTHETVDYVIHCPPGGGPGPGGVEP